MRVTLIASALDAGISAALSVRGEEHAVSQLKPVEAAQIAKSNGRTRGFKSEKIRFGWGRVPAQDKPGRVNRDFLELDPAPKQRLHLEDGGHRLCVDPVNRGKPRRRCKAHAVCFD